MTTNWLINIKENLTKHNLPIGLKEFLNILKKYYTNFFLIHVFICVRKYIVIWFLVRL